MKKLILIVSVGIAINGYAGTYCPASNPNGNVSIPDGSVVDNCTVEAQSITVGSNVQVINSQFNANGLTGSSNDAFYTDNFTIIGTMAFTGGKTQLMTGNYNVCTLSVNGSGNIIGSGIPGQTCELNYGKLIMSGSGALNCNMNPTQQYCLNS